MAKTEGELLDSLGIGEARSRRGRWIALAVILVVAIAAALAWGLRGPGDAALQYRTVEAKVGDLQLTVTATGSLEGVDTVDVGTEVSGRVIAVLVDFNERVKRGQVLARIDPEQLEARTEEALAQLTAAEASVRNARATEAEAQVKLGRTERLVERGLLARQELDTARATAERAKASTASALAQATVARASLRAARTNAQRAEVRAPIDGVVLSRAVEPGQTVAASFQAPVLFTLARDLTALTLTVDVDEADVGKVRDGQSATFTVEAFPERPFTSRVLSVRNVPKTETGVVTYEALLAVDNQEGLLRPGMTATAIIVTEQREQVVTVPTAALRFIPPDHIASRSRGVRVPGLGRMGGETARPAGSPRPKAKGGRTLWTLAEAPGAEPEPVEVQVGASDGRRVEIVTGIAPGTKVVIDQILDPQVRR